MSGSSRDHPTSLGDALRVAREILSQDRELVRRGTVETEAEQLVQAAWRRAGLAPLRRAELLTRAGDRFPGEAAEILFRFAGARAQGRLLQHVTGYQQFLDHEYAVDASTLVPRPETEGLVRLAIETLARDGGGEPALGAEIGVGSGVISLELLSRFPNLAIFATELVPAARELALRNARAILGEVGAARLRIALAQDAVEVLEPLARSMRPDRADFLVSNPPYLADEAEADADVLAQEPRSALFAGGGDPSRFYAAIAAGGARHLKPGGRVFLELPHERAEDLARSFERAGWGEAELFRDLAGDFRYLRARWTS